MALRTILIIEDEQIAAMHLERLLGELAPEATVIGTLQSIEESVEYFSNNPMPDLCMMDIRLSDGLSFRIFDQVEVNCPIVFTTAYDQYAIDAFKVNSIDYILKPISKEDLKRSLDKYHSHFDHNGATIPTGIDANTLRNLLQQLNAQKQYRTNFLIPTGDKLIPIVVSDVACLYLEDRLTRIVFNDGHEKVIDRPLDTIMGELNPKQFFRANRQYIIARQAIKEIAVWPISKLAITLTVDTPQKIIVSRAKVVEFKQWFTT